MISVHRRSAANERSAADNRQDNRQEGAFHRQYLLSNHFNQFLICL